jgi:hypothetical protein
MHAFSNTTFRKIVLGYLLVLNRSSCRDHGAFRNHDHAVSNVIVFTIHILRFTLRRNYHPVPDARVFVDKGAVDDRVAIIAIRDHPLAAATMGVDTALYKSLTFGVSAMYTGIAGALGALLSAYVSPDSFPVSLSIKFLVGSVVGGIVSISGAFIGALFIEFTPNFADQISKAAPDAIFGMFLIGLMYLMPRGAIGVVEFIRVHLRRVAVAKRQN